MSFLDDFCLDKEECPSVVLSNITDLSLNDASDEIVEQLSIDNHHADDVEEIVQNDRSNRHKKNLLTLLILLVRRRMIDTGTVIIYFCIYYIILMFTYFSFYLFVSYMSVFV